MIPSIPQVSAYRWTYNAYVLLFYIFLAAPLIVVGIFETVDKTVYLPSR